MNKCRKKWQNPLIDRDEYTDSIYDLSIYQQVFASKLDILLTNQFDINIRKKNDNVLPVINPAYISNWLNTYGNVCVYYDDILQNIVCLPCNIQRWDLYGEPCQVTVWSPYDSYTCTLDRQNQKFYVIFDNNLRIFQNPQSSRLILYPYVELLSQIQLTININVNQQRTPVIGLADNDNYLSVINFYKNYEGGVPFIKVKKLPNTDDTLDKQFKVLNLNAPYITDKLRSDLRNTWLELMETIGYKVNANGDKKERLIVDEVEGNEEETTSFYEARKQPREFGVLTLNQLFPDFSFELAEKKFALESITNDISLGDESDVEVHNHNTNNL